MQLTDEKDNIKYDLISEAIKSNSILIHATFEEDISSK